MTTKEQMILAIQIKTESCIASYLKSSSLKSSLSLQTSDGKKCDRMLATFEKTLEDARRNATRMVCTWLAWHYRHMDTEDLIQIVIDAGHAPATVGSMRGMMSHCAIHGPDKECRP